MTQIDKIKAEVKRLMNNRDSRLVNGSYFDFEHLLHFIESLEKEQDVDIELEAFNYRMEHGYPEDMNEMETFARHFYELGKIHRV